ncbi:Cocaine esterase [Roseovarius albus]|uniref:Cocaine esterase n=1 Tax=Roseovarius albus TaxID=1247867 RepID=A0A1X6Z4S0_9RHOB|nr:CocE/NonD family hydrolase [Roseovarius albus]SLN40841.1 Cocaine esterase [Roseovarius albus]
MKIDPDQGIVLSDGTRLSAKLWLPDEAITDTVPAILEYLPYRKSDGTAARDDTMHPWFASNGYACLRVDRRGTGDSEGLYDDEYSEQELSDGVEVINWIASQSWCNGSVGIQGISWGGFNGVQLAARAPEALKAVISIGTSVDRYNDDIHYKGGIQLGENIGWAATAMSWLSMPPDAALLGQGKARELWLQQLENTPFLAERWMRHADRDGYWKHGSICETFDDLKAAVLVIGGQHDGYRNAILGMVENLKCPVQGIMGPWSHKYPHISTIEPSIDYQNLALRWWDKWLKNIGNGAENDPSYRAYVMDSVAPDPSLAERPGDWFAVQDWNLTPKKNAVFALGRNTLGRGEAFEIKVNTDISCGRASGEFFPFGFGPGELPDDQRMDDELSACFDSESLNEEQIIIGSPMVTLRLSSDKPRGQVVARLCDVRPDGSSMLISLGMLDLRNFESFEAKQTLNPGQEIDVNLSLDQTAYRVPKGHKLRLAISGSYWPFAWPEGDSFTLTLTEGSLTLPGVSQEFCTSCTFSPPVSYKTRPSKYLREGAESKTWSEDPQTGEIVLEISGDHGRQLDEVSGLITESALTERWSIKRDYPASAKVEMVWNRSMKRDDWEACTKVVATMRGLKDTFEVEQSLTAWENDSQVHEKSWSASIPR